MSLTNVTLLVLSPPEFPGFQVLLYGRYFTNCRFECLESRELMHWSAACFEEFLSGEVTHVSITHLVPQEKLSSHFTNQETEQLLELFRFKIFFKRSCLF